MVTKKAKPAFGMKKESKPTAGSGNFKKLQGGVAAEYEKKGVSAKKAKEIGGAVAASIGRKKYGESAMKKASKSGKKMAKAKK